MSCEHRPPLRTITLLAALATALASLIFVATPAQAAIITQTIDGVSYDLDTLNETATVTGYDTSHGTSVTITGIVTDSGTDYQVTTIGDDAFLGDHLTSVHLPLSVRTIGSSAFEQNDLTSVDIRSLVTTIGASAFADNGLTTVTIPASVTSVGAAAFESNPLKTVRFLGDAPAAGALDTTDESFDSSDPALRLHYLPGSHNFTNPTWNGYTTVLDVTASTTDALHMAADECPSNISVTLTADLSEPTGEWAPHCNTDLDLNGHDLAEGNIIVAPTKTLTIDDNGGGGTLTTSASAEKPGIKTTDATLVIQSGTVVAEGGSSAAGIGGGAGDTGESGGTTTITGTANVTATDGGGAAAIDGGAGISGNSDGGAGGTVTIDGTANVTAKGIIGGTGIGGGSGSATGGAGAQVTIGEHAEVTAFTTLDGLTAIGGSSGGGSGGGGGAFGHLVVAGTLRVPAGTLNIPDASGDEVEVTSTGVITGSDDAVPTEATVTGDGQIANAGSITLATEWLTGGQAQDVQVKDHHYNVAFDTQGGSAAPGDVAVYAKSFEDGARTFPTAPTKADYTFGGWYTETNGGGTQIGASTTLPGSSADGTAVAITLYAKWNALAPTLTGSAMEMGQVGTAFTYTPTLTGSGATVTTSDPLPDGLELDSSTGAITGTPLPGSSGTYEVTLTADNDVEPNAGLHVSITIVEAPTLTGASTASGQLGQAFTYTPTALGGSPAPTVTVGADTLPDGLSVNSATGVITGTPTEAGSFPITLTAANEVGTAAHLSVTIAIRSDHVLGLAPTITGTVKEGKTLTAHAGPVVPGSATFTYHWRARGVIIKGALSSTYTLTKHEAGKRITVSIKAHSPGQITQDATSVPTRIVASSHARLVLSTHTVAKGQSFQVTATGLKAGQHIRIWLGGREAYDGHADKYGVVDRTVKFSTKIEPGIRRVRVSGYDSHGTRNFTIRTSVHYRIK